MNYLDMSRISSVKGATIKEAYTGSESIYYFDPDNNAKEISYQYNCSNDLTATFTLKVERYRHYEMNDNKKCKYCQSDLCVELSSDGQDSLGFYDDLQGAFDSAADYENVYVFLYNNVKGNFNINSGTVYLIGYNFSIISDNAEPALKVNNGSGLGIYSGVINNTSDGKALYICEGASVLIAGGAFLNINTENETLSAANFSALGYFFESSFTSRTAIFSSLKPLVYK
jgi:hypothetical protein